MPYGLSLEELTKSLSDIGSNSADYISRSVTGDKTDSIPLVNYTDFSEHVVFGNAERKLAAGINRILTEYPVGLSGTLFLDIANLSATNIFQVDEYKKKSTGFDLWLLEQFGKSSTEPDAAEKSITAAATNNQGETVPLIVVHRTESNELTDSDQIAMKDFLEDTAEKFEQESLSLIDTTPGTSYSYFVTTDGSVQNQNIIFDNRFELPINRAQNLDHMLPEVLFRGDEEGNLQKLLDIMSEQFDSLQVFVNQIPNLKKISYDDYNRIPDKMLPLLAEEFGVELFDSAITQSIDKFLVNSSSGYSSQETTAEIWKRILKSIVVLLKNKGTKKNLESIVRLYGLNDKLVKSEEYSVFNKPVLVREVDLVDTKALYSDGTNYVETVAGMTNSSRVFDFPANTDFTIEARVSATAVQNHTILKHPAFTLEINNQGRLSFIHQIDGAVTVTTPDDSISAHVHEKDRFVNVAAKRQGGELTVYLMSLTGSTTAAEDIVHTSSAMIDLAQISGLDFDTQGASQNPPGGSTTFPTQFPANGLFDGYIQEVRVWSGALADEDIREHVRNFESVSFQGSTSSPYNLDDNSLSAHWKLKEDRVLDNPWNFIQNSAKVEPLVTVVSQTYNDLTVDALTRTITSAATDFETEGLWQVDDVILINGATDAANDGIEIIVEDVTGGVITVSNHVLTSQGTLDSTLTLNRTDVLYNSNTASPINFTTTDNKYRHFSDVKKINSWYPMGLSVDNDKVLLEAPEEDEIDDSSILSMALKPMDAVNRDIHNYYGKIKLHELLGDPEEIYNKKYSGDFKAVWDEVSSRYRKPNEHYPMVDIDNFIQAISIFNDTLGGMFPFAEQFIPAKSSLNSQGVFIENHILERNKIPRIFGVNETKDSEYVGAPDLNPTNEEITLTVEAAPNTASSTTLVVPNTSSLEPNSQVAGTNIAVGTTILEITDGTTIELSEAHSGFSSDEQITFTLPLKAFLDASPGDRRMSDDIEQTERSMFPSVTHKRDTEQIITNHFLPGALKFQDSSSGNITELHPTACTTASFQGFQYEREKNFINRSLTTERVLINVTKKSTTNSPRISEARVAKLLPVKRIPADPENTEIDVTLDNLIIDPTAPSTSQTGFINGKIRLLSKGQPFNSESPTFRFEFPTSADGTNLFVAEMGDIDAGQGRIIEDIDNTFVTNINQNDVQMKLTLANVVTSLSAVNLPDVTQNQVDDSKQGSLGVVPIRITNLFNNNTQIVRVAINAIANDNDLILTQLANQGGVKLSS